MMPARNLMRMVLKNTVRSKRHFALSAFGIVIGIWAFVLFLALTQKAGTVLENVFPVGEVQVVPKRVSLLGKDASKKLDDSIVNTILARPEVKSAVPRMNLSFPAAGRGDFEGSDLKFEVGGFADGVDPSYVRGGKDERINEYFKDWELLKDDPNRVACTPPPRDPEEDVIQSPGKPPSGAKPVTSGWGDTVDAGVGSGSATGSGSASGSATDGSAGSAGSGSAGSGSAGSGSAGSGSAGSGSAGGPMVGSAAPSGPPVPRPPRAKPPAYYNPCPEPDRYYCDDTERMCKHRVPIVLSATVVELYNNQFAKSHGMPMADKNLVNMLIQQRGLSSMRFSIGLGNTTISGTGNVTKKRPRRVEAVVVGVSPRAMQVGVTMPIEYVRRWNQEYLGDDAATSYSSIIVTLKDTNQLAPFTSWIEDEQGLAVSDSLGRQFATVIFVIRLLFLIISIAILAISIINIGHNFFVQVSERRREIGIMRAVGASELDVMFVMLGEAAMIGIIGGLIGIGLAVGSGTIWNYVAAHKIPAFPFKPSSWFDFKIWIWGGGLLFSTVSCVLGGFLPARRAAKMEPAQALAQN